MAEAGPDSGPDSGPEAMRAAFIEALGPPENIRIGYLPIPEPGPGHVLVKVEAVAVNHVDTFVRSGAYPASTPFPFVVGRDLVGTVTDDTDGFVRGERVWCNSMGHGGRQGAAAEYVAVPHERLYRVPEGVDTDSAVAVAHPANTAHLALHRHGALNTGETVYIGGGAGHVGSAAIAIAAQTAGHIVTSARADDLDYCRSIGADTALDYRDPDFDEKLRENADPPIDVYIDTSGRHDLELVSGVLAFRGRIVLMAGMSAKPQLPAGALYTNDGSIRGFAISNATVSELAGAAAGINDMLAADSLKPRNAEILDLNETAHAHARLENGQSRGTRLVLQP